MAPEVLGERPQGERIAEDEPAEPERDGEQHEDLEQVAAHRPDPEPSHVRRHRTRDDRERPPAVANQRRLGLRRRAAYARQARWFRRRHADPGSYPLPWRR